MSLLGIHISGRTYFRVCSTALQSNYVPWTFLRLVFRYIDGVSFTVLCLIINDIFEFLTIKRYVVNSLNTDLEHLNFYQQILNFALIIYSAILI